ncbi:MAG: hypothetical protein BHW09_03620 [Clostridium sp. CAG:245_30_32]|nr:MAG: hypothetical protein BHW09_03620 [Clostridium sp. CAG:245_30_32]
MKKRVPLAMMGLLIIFCISSVLFNRQANLTYGDVKEFCYEVQKAGHPISPDPETIRQYDVKADRYGNLILTVTGIKGEEVICEMTPDCQIIDKISEIDTLKYLYAVIALASLLIFIAAVKEYTKRRIGA